MKNCCVVFALFIFVAVLEMHSTSAAVLRPRLERTKPISHQDGQVKTSRRRRHHRSPKGVEELLNLVESDGYTILLLHRRGRRNAEIKLTAMQLKNLRETLGNAVLEQITKSSTPAQQQYNNCYLNQLLRTKSTTMAEQKCKGGYAP